MAVNLKEISLVLPREKEEEMRFEAEGVYDLVIVGGGPAGLTAAVYAARKKMKTLLVSLDLGGQPLLTASIENYMGYQYITGKELVDKFEEQVRQFPIDMLIGEEVIKVYAEQGKFKVITRSGKEFTGKTVIIASGKRSRELNVPGERELVGRGVSYCAVCDAPLFVGRDVAVIGGGNSALQAVVDLIKIANNIYIVNRAPDWQGDPILVETVERSSKVKAFLGYEVREIQGQDKVKGIVIESRENEEQVNLSVEGIFIEIGLVPNSEPVKGLVALNEKGEIIVDCGSRTNIPGLFAAGDVTTVPDKQIIIAAGDGAKAALGAYSYLLRHR